MREGKETEEEGEEEGGRGELWFLCSLWSLPFWSTSIQASEKKRERRQREQKKEQKRERVKIMKEKTGAGKKRKLRLNKRLSFLKSCYSVSVM